MTTACGNGLNRYVPILAFCSTIDDPMRSRYGSAAPNPRMIATTGLPHTRFGDDNVAQRVIKWRTWPYPTAMAGASWSVTTLPGVMCPTRTLPRRSAWCAGMLKLRRRETKMRIWPWLPVLIATWCGTPACAVDCATWNTRDFDRSSSAVRTCLAAGAALEAGDDCNRPPTALGGG